MEFLGQAWCLCMAKNADLKKTDLEVIRSAFFCACLAVAVDLPLHTDVMEEDRLKKVRIEVDREVAVDLPSLL